jgi:tRNA threonylcarbamoyladenosine biosynthesis protein TsaE
MDFIIPSIDSIDTVAGNFLTAIKYKKHLAFYGSMGVGKTTFIKALCHNLGVDESVTSPTFSIVNEYYTKKGEIIYHFDFFRINNIEELFDLGYEEYLYSSNYCFIEWPEKGESLLPDHFLKITMQEMPDGARLIII